MSSTLWAAFGAQAVAIIAGITGLVRWLLNRHLTDSTQTATLERIAAWFPHETPDAPESLPSKVDRVAGVATEALEVARTTGADLVMHMREEERLRVADAEDRQQRQGRIDDLLDQLTKSNPEIRRPA